MSIASALRSVLGLGLDPMTAALQPSAANNADLQQAGTPAGAAPMPAIPTAAAPGAAPGVQPPAQPTDLQGLYSQLLASSKADAGFNSGLDLIAAGFASPENRNALVSMAGSEGGNATGNATNALNTIIQLRDLQTKQAQAAATNANLPTIATQLGIPMAQVQQLQASGKLADVVAAANKPDNEITKLGTGETVIVNKNSKQVVANLGGAKEEDKVPAKAALLSEYRQNFGKYGFPDPASTAPADVARWKQITDATLGGGGVNVSVGSPEKTEQQALGAAVGKEGASYIEAGQTARNTLPVLNGIQGALENAGDNYTGPFADAVMQGKEALAGAFGVDLKGLSGTEVANKLGFQMATQAAKAISPRPSQLEFAKALEVQPGIFLSKQGSQAMIAFTKQHLQDQMNLADLAHDPNNFGKMNQVEQQYYATHPVMSPFDPTRPLNQSDINTLYKAKGINTPRPEPTTDAVAALRSDPSKAKEYDEYYGPGMSRMVLGQ